MNPLFKVVAITLLTAHPDTFKKCLSVTAGMNAAPPKGISLIQLVRSIEQRGAHLLKQLIIQEEILQKRQQKQNSNNQDGTSIDSDAANNNTGNQNNNSNNNNNNSSVSNDAEMNAVGTTNNDDEDLTYEQKVAQMNSRAGRFKQIWPQNTAPEIWVPDVVKQLMQMGAIENENAGMENRRPVFRLTQQAFNAAWNELVGMRMEEGANSIFPTEIQRRKNKNKVDQKKRKKSKQKKAKREGERKPIIMAKKMEKIKSKKVVKKYGNKVTASKKKGAGKKRGKK